MAVIQIGPIQRILLLGGGELLANIAKWSKSEGFVVDVITAPRHAEEILSSSEMSLVETLKSYKIPTLVVDNINCDAAKKVIKNAPSTFALSLGAAWIFGKSVIEEQFGSKLFNLHGTRLPQNRGGGGFSWQIMMGNRLGFCLIHLIDTGIDTGDIVHYHEFIYPPHCRTPADYAKYYCEENLQFVIELLKSLKNRPLEFNTIRQTEYLSTYWPRLNTPSQAWIDWNWSSEEIERFICAFDDPYLGARSMLGDKIVQLKKAFTIYQDGMFHPFQAGLVYRSNRRWICVAGRTGGLVIEDLRDESGNNLLDRVHVGDSFSTPNDYLEKRTKRIIYTSSGIKKS